MQLKNPTEDQRRGYLGKCALRSLKYFDVGPSFISDSLHNLYGGIMVRICLFLLSLIVELIEILFDLYMSYLIINSSGLIENSSFEVVLELPLIYLSFVFHIKSLKITQLS